MRFNGALQINHLGSQQEDSPTNLQSESSRLQRYAKCVIIYAICVRARHWMHSFRRPGRGFLPRPLPSRRSGGFSRNSLPTSAPRLPACSGSFTALVDTGILERRREGTRVYFRAQKRSPIYRELRGIVEKTAGIIPILQTLLAPFGRKILCAFIYGSVARAREHATSDIDLMVIGQVGLSELTPALRKAERALGRDVNATTYSVDEFREGTEKKDHFLTALLKRPKQFVKGTERELDTIIDK